MYPAYKPSVLLQTPANNSKFVPWVNLPIGFMKQEKNVSVMNKGNEMYWTQSVLSAADMLKPHIAFYNDSFSYIIV